MERCYVAGRGCVSIDQLWVDKGFRSRTLPTNIRFPSRKNNVRNHKNFEVKGVGSPSKWSSVRAASLLDSGIPSRGNLVQANVRKCGCGFRSEFFGQSVGSSSGSSTRVRDRHGLPRVDVRRGSISSEYSVHGRLWRRAKVRDCCPRARFAEERDSRREFARRVRSAFGFKEHVGAEASKMERPWRIISAAAAAGLSFTLCSSALALPTTDGWTQMLSESKDLQVHVETQLKRELQAQIKVQKEWLEEIGQPLNEWSIDDTVRKSLEEKSRSRLDESGKSLSKWEMLESEVVPIFKPEVQVARKKEKVILNAGITQESPLLEKVAESSQSTTVTVTVQPKQGLDGSPELVAVAAVPLGSVVSVAGRTVGSAASIAALQAGGGAVPGISFLRRMMMHFGGGGLAGAMGATVVYPLDTIKTRMQAQSKKDGEEGQYKDEWDCMQQLVAQEGLGSLYSGLIPQLIGIAPEKAVKLTVNEILMEMLVSQMPGVGAWALELIAGGGGGFSQVVFTNPMEIVKVRLQTQAKDGKQKNTWDVVKELGIQGLYDGSTMTMARDIPGTAIFFAVYALMQQLYGSDQIFMAGFVAAIPATILVTPFDVVKTRLQMERTAGEDVPYKNGYECFWVILHEEGIGALFKGSVARVLKTSPQLGITLMLYNMLGGS